MEDICKKLAKDVKKGKLLGKGEQAVIYDFGKTVIRVSKGRVNLEILRRASESGISPTIFGIFDCDGLTYIQMEKLTDPFIASKYGKQMARLLTQMVKAGILHNDIHAENLMAKDGKLFLIDFENATLIDTMTQSEFDKEFKYHTTYTDETYSLRIPIDFTATQLKAIAKVRSTLKK